MIRMHRESQMIGPIQRLLAARWPRAGVVLEEFGVGYGVADLVVARLSRRGVAERERVGPIEGLASRAAVQVLLAVQRRPKTADELSEITGIPPKRLRSEVIPALASGGFVEKSSTGVVRALRPYRPIAEETWAVEAKLKNWFEGACQARRYQHFAHRVYLAVPVKKQDAVKKDVLRPFNVGLIIVDEERVRIAMQPRRSSPRSEDLFLLSNERIWGATSSTSAKRHSSQ